METKKSELVKSILQEINSVPDEYLKSQSKEIIGVFFKELINQYQREEIKMEEYRNRMIEDGIDPDNYSK